MPAFKLLGLKSASCEECGALTKRHPRQHHPYCDACVNKIVSAEFQLKAEAKSERMREREKIRLAEEKRLR